MTGIPSSLEDWVAELRNRAHSTGTALSRIEGLITGIALRLEGEERRGDKQETRLTALEKFRYMAAGAIAVLVFAFPVTIGVVLTLTRG